MLQVQRVSSTNTLLARKLARPPSQFNPRIPPGSAVKHVCVAGANGCCGGMNSVPTLPGRGLLAHVNPRVRVQALVDQGLREDRSMDRSITSV